MVTGILLGILVAVFIVLMIKLWERIPVARIFIVTVLSAVVLVSGIYSFVKIDTYLNAKGGILGSLTGYFDKNSVVVDDLTFSFDNIMFVKQDDDYVIEMTTNDIIKITSDDSYGLFVNDTPCNFDEYSSQYIKARYTYNFQNRDMSTKKVDTLHLTFSLNENSTIFVVTTYGGEDAVKLWNYYFNRNNFIVSLKKLDNDKVNKVESDNAQTAQILLDKYVEKIDELERLKNQYQTAYEADEITIEELNSRVEELNTQLITLNEKVLLIEEQFKDIENQDYHIVASVSDDGVVDTQILLDGEKAIQPSTPQQKDYYTFLGWSADNVNVYDFNTPVTSNMVLKPLYRYNQVNETFDLDYTVDYSMDLRIVASIYNSDSMSLAGKNQEFDQFLTDFKDDNENDSTWKDIYLNFKFISADNSEILTSKYSLDPISGNLSWIEWTGSLNNTNRVASVKEYNSDFNGNLFTHNYWGYYFRFGISGDYSNIKVQVEISYVYK